MPLRLTVEEAQASMRDTENSSMGFIMLILLSSGFLHFGFLRGLVGGTRVLDSLVSAAVPPSPRCPSLWCSSRHQLMYCHILWAIPLPNDVQCPSPPRSEAQPDDSRLVPITQRGTQRVAVFSTRLAAVTVWCVRLNASFFALRQVPAMSVTRRVTNAVIFFTAR